MENIRGICLTIAYENVIETRCNPHRQCSDNFQSVLNEMTILHDEKMLGWFQRIREMQEARINKDVMMMMGGALLM